MRLAAVQAPAAVCRSTRRAKERIKASRCKNMERFVKLAQRCNTNQHLFNILIGGAVFNMQHVSEKGGTLMKQ